MASVRHVSGLLPGEGSVPRYYHYSKVLVRIAPAAAELKLRLAVRKIDFRRSSGLDPSGAKPLPRAE